MTDIEDQLHAYGGALEQHFLARPAPLRRVRRRRAPAVGVAVLAVAVFAAAAALLARSGPADDHITTAPTPGVSVGRQSGVFSTPTGTVLLISDGLDGVTAIDLDRRVVGRRVIDGERAGDQPHRLTLTGDHLVVGWGDIYAAPLSGGPSRRLARGTIHIPAAEPNSVWVLDSGPRLGSQEALVWRVDLDNQVQDGPAAFDFRAMEHVTGVPGGLLVNTADGVGVWRPQAGGVIPVGPGRADSATSDGTTVAWCSWPCSTVRTAALPQPGDPTAASAGGGTAFSPDGRWLAYLRVSGEEASLVVRRGATGSETVVGRRLSQYSGLAWSPDGSQLFVIENSYQRPDQRIARYVPATGAWEVQRLPVGDGTRGLAVSTTEARWFFADRLTGAADCPAAAVFPRDREGVCSFAFFTSDDPSECVASGPRTVLVPDGVGRTLDEARIAMQQAGLKVVGDGTDPFSARAGAEVVAQQPAGGELVPEGACIGFRTSD